MAMRGVLCFILIACLTSCSHSEPDSAFVVNYSNENIFVATCSDPPQRGVWCEGWTALSRDETYRRQVPSGTRLFVLVTDGADGISFGGTYEYRDFPVHGTGFRVSETGSTLVTKFEWQENLFTYSKEENRRREAGPPGDWFIMRFFRAFDGSTSVSVHPN